MKFIRSWTALFRREYLEHKLAFTWFPLGILGLLLISGVSSLGANRPPPMVISMIGGASSKLFEIGYLALAALWMAYLAVALFFYFGDAFNADRRNNNMFFWKSMPVSDFKILGAKFLAGMLLFPAIIFAIVLATGALFFGFINIAVLILPHFLTAQPVAMLGGFVQVSLFVLVYYALSLLWYAPFFAWVAGLSAVFGRWSLALAFVVPGLIAVVENIIFFSHVPRGGYFWGFLSNRLQYGLADTDFPPMLTSPHFDAVDYTGRLLALTDWLAMGLGLVFTLIVIYLASEYRRRRIV